jgi:MiaB-like tRNA modifying enzyme
MATKIFIKTFGCALNQSDSELMAGLLKKADFEIVDNEEDAFVIIINTCSVKQPTENKFFKYLEHLKTYEHKKIIIAGCIPQTLPEKLKGYPLLGTSQVSNIVQLVEEVINNNPIEMLAKENLQRLNLPKIRKNKVIEIIPICEGCLGEPCAYCIVKKARGELRSYPVEEILAQLKEAVVKDKIPEIWLTAQDTGCYGKDIGTNLPSLLKEIVKIPGDFKIRLGMINPNHTYEFLSDLIGIYKSEKLFKFLHIPVQSGNNDILQSMRRKYTVEQFKEIINKFRQHIPDITIATDIICGFPGESDLQFNDSLTLIKQITPDVLNISRFWPRPKTKAAKMKDQVHGAETKKRSTLMADIFANISRMQNEKWISWEGEILIDEIGKDNTLVGRNFAYKPVIVRRMYKLGQKVNVKITKITSNDLRAL